MSWGGTSEISMAGAVASQGSRWEAEPEHPWGPGQSVTMVRTKGCGSRPGRRYEGRRADRQQTSAASAGAAVPVPGQITLHRRISRATNAPTGSAGHTVQARSLDTVLGRRAATLTLRRELRFWHGAVAGSGPHVWRWGLPTRQNRTKTRPDPTGQDRTDEARQGTFTLLQPRKCREWGGLDGAGRGHTSRLCICRSDADGQDANGRCSGRAELQAIGCRTKAHAAPRPPFAVFIYMCPRNPALRPPASLPGHSAFVPLRGDADGGPQRSCGLDARLKLTSPGGVSVGWSRWTALYRMPCVYQYIPPAYCAPQRHGTPGTVQTCHDDG